MKALKNKDRRDGIFLCHLIFIMEYRGRRLKTSLFNRPFPGGCVINPLMMKLLRRERKGAHDNENLVYTDGNAAL